MNDDRVRTTSRLLHRHPFWVLAVAVFVVLLIAFVVVEALRIPLLTDPAGTLGGGPAAGAASVGLLVVDVVVPLPSSLLMTLNGSLFGVVPGAGLSLLGGTLATVVAVAVGRYGGGLADRVVAPEQRVRAERLFARYGMVAVAATRPVPLVAETVAVIAGAARLSWGRAWVAGVVGNLVPASVYALAGATADDPVSGFVVLAGVLALTGTLWLVGAAGVRLRARR